MTEALEITKQADSTIIALIMVMVIAIIVLRPVLKMYFAERDKRHQRDIDQQNNILSVIKANTEVNASLKTVLEEDRKTAMNAEKNR